MKFDDIDVKTPVGYNGSVISTNTHFLDDLTDAVHISFDGIYVYDGLMYGAKFFSKGDYFDPIKYILLVHETEDNYYLIKLLKDGALDEDKVLSLHDARLFLVSILSRTFSNVEFNPKIGILRGNAVLDDSGDITSIRGTISRYSWSVTHQKLVESNGKSQKSDEPVEGWTEVSGANFVYRYDAIEDSWVWDLVVRYVTCSSMKFARSAVVYERDGVDIHDREPRKFGWFKSLFSSENLDPTKLKSWTEYSYTLTSSEMTYKGCTFDRVKEILNEND